MMTSTLQIQMDNARTFIHHNYQRMPSLHRLALLVGTNECTLKKCFKQSFGPTVFGYLFNLRMEMAVQLLCNTDEPVSTIGYHLGYERQSHFCTAFKRKYGVSPSLFRDQQNKAVASA